MAATVEEIGKQLADAEKENRKLDHQAERMRIERDDAIEELQTVEAQFDGAMEIIADLKARVATLAEERDALVSRIKVMDNQIAITEDQRDALKLEVDESRKALDEIRCQVADACVMSQRYYYQPEDQK